MRGRDWYGFTITLSGLSFDEALSMTTAALKTEGFGVLSDIDVQRAMKVSTGPGAIHIRRGDRLAEAVRFELTGPCGPPVFKFSVELNRINSLDQLQLRNLP